MIARVRIANAAGLLLGVFLCLFHGTQTPGVSVLHAQSSTREESDADQLEQKDRVELQRILQNKLERLNDLQTRTFEARQTMNRGIRQENTGLNQLRQDVKDEERRKSEQQSTLSELRKSIQMLQKRKQRLRASLDNLDDVADQLQDELATHVRRTVPYERSKRKKAISTSDSDGSTQEATDRLRRLTDAARSELMDGRTSDLFHRRTPLSPSSSARKKYARLLRIGQNTLIYVTEDGKQAGYYEWNNNRWQVHQASPRQARRFKHAIDVHRGQRQPVRLPLPVILPPEGP